MERLNSLFDLAREKGARKVVIAGAAEFDILKAVEACRKRGVLDGVLVGDKDEIKKVADEVPFSLDNYELVHEPNEKKQSALAVSLIKEGKADILVKGLVSTADYMRAILDKSNGLQAGALLSHVAVFDVPAYHKLLILTDAAVTIAPGIPEKVTLINNAVLCANAIGVEMPKVACVAAVEKVNPGKMPATTDAALLSVMNKRGQIPGCIVDGPFGFDNAISKKSAEIKKIKGEVAGDADIILANDIESANVLYKSFSYFANAACGAIVLGASAPVVLTSRADNDRTKMASLVLGVLISHVN